MCLKYETKVSEQSKISNPLEATIKSCKFPYSPQIFEYKTRHCRFLPFTGPGFNSTSPDKIKRRKTIKLICKITTTMNYSHKSSSYNPSSTTENILGENESKSQNFDLLNRKTILLNTIYVLPRDLKNEYRIYSRNMRLLKTYF